MTLHLQQPKRASEEKTEAVFEQFNCRQFVLDLKPAQFDSADVKRLREDLQVSRSFFASLIGVSVKTVQAWEQGKNRPQPVAARFMEEIPGIRWNRHRRPIAGVFPASRRDAATWSRSAAGTYRSGGAFKREVGGRFLVLSGV